MRTQYIIFVIVFFTTLLVLFQLTLNNGICVPCYLLAQRVVDSSHRSSAVVAPSTISQPPSSQQIEQAKKYLKATNWNN